MTAMKMSDFMTRLFAGRTKANIFVCSYANNRADAKNYPPRDMVTRRPDQIEKFLKQYDVPGRAVYFCVNTVRDRNRNKDEIAEINCLHVDIDFKGVVEKQDAIIKVLKGLKHKTSAVVSSGHGLHCYWLLQPPLGPEHIGSIEMILAKLAEVLAGDKSAAEISRVLRLPGSHNSKNDEWLEVEVISELCSWSTYSVGLLDKWLHGQEPLLTYKSTKKKAAVEREKQSLNIWQQLRKETRADTAGLDIEELLSQMTYGDTQGNGIDDTHQRIVGDMVRNLEPLSKILTILREPTKRVYERDRKRGDKPWSEKEFKSGITAKFKWCTKRDAQKEDEASGTGAVPEAEAAAPLAGVDRKKLNGHKHHDIDTDPPSEDEFISVEAREAWGKPNTDLFTAFVVPKMKPEYLPEMIANVAFSNAASMNGDPGALAMSMMTAASAMIATDIKIKVMPQEHHTWKESARVWTVLVGDPGTTKSPLMRAAIEPITSIDFKLGKEFNTAIEEYKEMSKEEKAKIDKPVRRTFILNNISIEAGADIMFDNPQGVLFFSDEFRALLGTATKYVNKGNSGAEHTSKAFLLSAYNSEYAKVNRIGRGEKFGYPSISMLGSIQPDLLHRLAAAAEDNDGFLQRMSPVFIENDELGDISYDEAEYPFKLFHDLIDRLYRCPLQHGAVIKFSQKAQLWMNRMLEYCKIKHNLHRASEPALSTAYRKLEAMYARWCLIYHMIENPEAKHAGTISPEIARKVFIMIQEYLEPHIIQLHKMSSLNEEHKTLRAIILYALSHKLKTLIVRDLRQGSNQLRLIERKDMRRYMEKLEAMNYGRILARGKRDRYDSIAFVMNPNVAAELQDEIRQENARLKAARDKFAEMKERGLGWLN